MARLSSLMRIPQIYVLTHDSIGVGEDGPTHQPIEQLAQFRAMPNFYTFRPADRVETQAAWYFALTKKDAPTALVLSRQNLPQLASATVEKAMKGAYIVADSSKETPDTILIATGSEVEVALEAKEKLAAKGLDARVVSMPCMELFEDQTAEYKESVLPAAVTNRVSVEAASVFGWGNYASKQVGMSTFGTSAPGELLFDHFGITSDAVVAKVCE